MSAWLLIRDVVVHDAQTSYPGVSVIMPLKGTREHDTCNWLSHFNSAYEGELEFIAVVESAFDPAAASIKAVAEEFPKVDQCAQ